jgi:hypothetical protein
MKVGKEVQMSLNLIRWSGLAAILDGVLWIAWAIQTGLQPRGCIGDECAFRPMREGGTIDTVLFYLAMLLLAVGVAGLVIHTRNAGRLGRLGWIGSVASVLGVVALIISGLTQDVFFGGDFPLMPFLVIPVGLVLLVGFLLLGITILRARVLPLWVAVLFVVGTLAILGVNDQNAQVFMAIPFGIAWVAVGYILWWGKDTLRAIANVNERESKRS